jgi:chemotaxis protein CheY-P-specific phosphatase CheC
MTLDTRTLGEVVGVIDEGARAAAGVLSRRSGTEIAVDTTGVSVVTGTDLCQQFGGTGHVGVTLGLTGAFPAETLLALERAGAEEFVDAQRHDDRTGLNAMDRSSVTEAATVAVDEFTDSLQTHFGESVEPTPPTYHDRIDDATLLAETSGVATLVFESELSDRHTATRFSLVTVPGRRAVDRLLTDEATAGVAVSLDGLGKFHRRVRDGATEAAGLFSAITDIETRVGTSRLRYVPVSAVSSALDTGPVAGTVFGLNDGRDGYLAVLFAESSALSVADAMLPVGATGRFDEMTRSAIEELGGVMTGSFLGAWAHVFDDPVEHTSPAFVNGGAATVLDPLLRRIATKREHAFVVDTTIRTADGAPSCTMLALPADHRLTELRSLRQSGCN